MLYYSKNWNFDVYNFFRSNWKLTLIYLLWIPVYLCIIADVISFSNVKECLGFEPKEFMNFLAKNGTWLWPFWKESPAGIATQTVCIFVQIDRILLSLSEKWPKPPLANSRIRNMPEMHDLLCLVWKRVFWYIFNFSQKFNFYKTLIFDILQFLRKKLDDFLVYFTKKSINWLKFFAKSKNYDPKM